MDAVDTGGTGREYLTETQYADDRNLVARQSIYLFQQPRVSMFGWVLDLAGLDGDEVVLDAGCGNGLYLEALARRGHGGATAAVDLSPGMIAAAKRRAGNVSYAVADVAHLPLPGDCADVVLAMMMLYHVPDRAAGIAELRRVLRPGGLALVGTNSLMHLEELDGLLCDSFEAVTGVRPARTARVVSFTMESAEPELRAAFEQVDRHDLHSELVLTEVEPAIAYARSVGPVMRLDPDVKDAGLREFESRLRARIEAAGAFRTRTAPGCFVCR
jgi:SAM-dependent methyltransferase